jgi:NAD+ synthetase
VLRIALAQSDFPVGDPAANAERVIGLLRRAGGEGAALVLFPELAISGYLAEDLFLRLDYLALCETACERVREATREAPAALVGAPERRGGGLRNVALLLAEGRVRMRHVKQRLPNYGVFDECRYFVAGRSASAVGEVGGVRIGLLVCEDLWAEAPFARLAREGAELVLAINASPFERDKAAAREHLLRGLAARHGAAVAYLNLVGGQDDLVFDGASLLVDGDGSVSGRAPAFAEALLHAEFHREGRRFSALWPPPPDEPAEALLYRAAVRGLADYAAKNGFRAALLGLSGGIDSALVLTMACDALGAENVVAVSLPSRHTSALSRRLAVEQCRRLRVELLEYSIEAPFAGFLAALADPLSRRPPDVTEENLQSRCRGTMLMALSNLSGRLLLATGNKSEFAVGYATLYGDMAGGYAPLKDLYKTEVYALARWRNGQDEVIPEEVLRRAPTAELRPGQLDQDSLPPYEELDAVLRAFIDEDRSPEEIVADGIAPPETVRRVVRMVLASEYKRRQAPPGPKLGRRAFGRERRYPIANAWSPFGSTA